MPEHEPLIVKVIGFTTHHGIRWDVVCESNMGDIQVDPWVGCALPPMTELEKESMVGKTYRMSDYWQKSSGTWLCNKFEQLEAKQET